MNKRIRKKRLKLATEWLSMERSIGCLLNANDPDGVRKSIRALAKQPGVKTTVTIENQRTGQVKRKKLRFASMPK